MTGRFHHVRRDNGRAKVAYPTKWAAVDALDEVQRLVPSDVPRHAYQCPTCAQWHLGRRVGGLVRDGAYGLVNELGTRVVAHMAAENRKGPGHRVAVILARFAAGRRRSTWHSSADSRSAS